MGLTRLNARIANPSNTENWVELPFLIDSGAMYSCVPRKTLDQLGIKPHTQREFVLANGEVIRREMGTAAFEYQDLRGDSLVMFGEEGDLILLGVTTLEAFGFILDPLRGELKPVPLLM
jgi:clan AA aspartic protease